jgi:hypothetical protein
MLSIKGDFGTIITLQLTVYKNSYSKIFTILPINGSVFFFHSSRFVFHQKAKLLK